MEIKQLRVLMVEDDPTQSAEWKMLLETMPRQQMAVEVAERLSHAVERLGRDGIHVILLDLSLPDSKGIQTVLKVRECAPAIPIIVVTGDDNEELAIEAMEIGAQDYLVKGTFDGPLLARAIRYAVHRLDSERAVNEQRRRQKLVMASVPDCRIYFKDLQSRFLEVNMAFVKRYGLRDAQEAIGKTDFDFFTQEHASPAAKDEEEVIRTGQPLVGKVEKETLPDGGRSWALTTKIPLHDEHGRIIGTFGISRDITDLKNAEEKLLAANERLQGVLGDLLGAHEKLKATQLQLIQAEKLKSLGQMAAGVVHEIKNPLQILNMGIECLGEFFLGGDEQMNGVVAEMKLAVHRAEMVIKGMLNYSSDRVQLREVGVNALINQTLSFVRYEVMKAKVKVIASLDDRVSPCLLDSTKIEQVLINVFNNACQAMKEGGSLAISTSEKVFDCDEPEEASGSGGSVRFQKGDRVAVIQIQDSGPGIPKHVLENIFNAFVTTKPEGEGSGLGLGVAKNIVDSHGGRLTVMNAPEGGARVTILFRCVNREA